MIVYKKDVKKIKGKITATNNVLLKLEKASFLRQICGHNHLYFFSFQGPLENTLPLT